MDISNRGQGMRQTPNKNTFNIQKKPFEKGQVNAPLDLSWNWFFYWKVSPSLWEQRLKDFPKYAPVFIPINWSFHTVIEDRGLHYDFGQFRNDCNLKELETLVYKNDLTPVFLLPIGPSPILKNGGIADWIKSDLSCDYSGALRAVLDSEESIISLKSFYDPKVFKAFKSFAAALGKAFVTYGFKSKVKGAQWGVFEDQGFENFSEDYSQTFKNSFNRFLDRNESFENNESSKKKFQEMLMQLLCKVSEDCLPSYWDGVIKFSALGGQRHDWLTRSLIGSASLKEGIWNNIFRSMGDSIIPSPILLNDDEINDSVRLGLKQLVNYSYYKHVMEEGLSESYSTKFLPLVACKIFSDDYDFCKKIGMLEHLDKSFFYNYQMTKEFELDFTEHTNNRINIFFASRLKLNEFKGVLKLLFAGKKVILDISNIKAEFLQALELFAVENNLKSQVVKILGELRYYSFGEGQLITIQSEEIINKSANEIKNFWDKVYKYLNCQNLTIQTSELVKSFILSRESSSSELNYDEIRRVFLVNLSNKKESIFIPSKKGQVFLRYQKFEGASIKSSPSGVSIELEPNIVSTLDFGFMFSN